MDDWLNKVDRLLGGDGNAPQESSLTAKALGGATNPSDMSDTNSPLHAGARELVDHLAPAAMKIESDRVHLVGEGWVRVCSSRICLRRWVRDRFTV
jgi:hypothetical protein